MIWLEQKLFWVFWFISFIMQIEMQNRVIFSNIYKIFFHKSWFVLQNWCDSIWYWVKLQYKKAIFSHIFYAGDVWRCLSKDLSISMYLHCQVCKEISPFWPVLCEKNDFQNRILRLTLNLSHICWGLNPF